MSYWEACPPCFPLKKSKYLEKFHQIGPGGNFFIEAFPLKNNIDDRYYLALAAP